MNRLLTDWQQKVSAWQNAVETATSSEMAATVVPPDPAAFAPDIWASISAKTGTRKETVTRGTGRRKREETITVPTYEFEQSWALPAVVWILRHPEAFAAAFDESQQGQISHYAEALIKSVQRVHFAHPGIRDICPVLAQNAGVREYELMEKIYNRNNDPTTRACAALAMSLMLNNPMIAGVEGSAAMTRGKRIYYLKQALLFGDPETPFGQLTLGEVAREQTYRLRYLAEGCIPPQIKLRDAEGRVVTCPQPDKTNLLLFWTPDEPLGASIVENLQKMQDKYPDLVIWPIAPFQTPEVMQQLLLRVPGMQQSLLDDEKGSAGIAYRVNSLPTAVLLSNRSTILFNGAPGVQLQTVLDNVFRPVSTDHPKVIIKSASDAPVLQPGSQARPADDKPQSPDAPPLREMPTM